MSVWYSQNPPCQDQWLVSVLGERQGGTFVDIGCNHPTELSNTYYVEKNLGWAGIGIDNEPEYERLWWAMRPRSRFVCADATRLDYRELFDRYQMPQVIEFASLDLEPPTLTLAALKALLNSGRKFLALCFEHDSYRGFRTRDESVRLLTDAGYKRDREGNQDDFWILV